MNQSNGEMGETLQAGGIDPRLLSLAMAFVPEQHFETPYEPALAFNRGTIFPALDLPFLGEEAVPHE